MAIVEWNDSFHIGVPAIDAQHEELAGLINRVDQAVIQGSDRAEIGALIKKLHDYTVFHFTTEEGLMDYNVYPFYFQQVEEHLTCASRAMEFHRDFLSGKNVDLGAFLDFISQWFIQHTTGLDRTLGETLRRTGHPAATRPAG